VNPVESEVGDRESATSSKQKCGKKVVRVCANRLRRIPEGAVETGDPQDGMFLDSIRSLERIVGTQVRRKKTTGQVERHFKVRISGSRSTCWTPESDLPDTVVKLYNSRDGIGNSRHAVDPTQVNDTPDADENMADDGDSITVIEE